MRLIFLIGSVEVLTPASSLFFTPTSTTTSIDSGNGRSTPRSEAEILASPYLKVFKFDRLRVATQDFHIDGLLGEGGFGCVFKGWLHQLTLRATKPGKGMAVAVKKLVPHGTQGHEEWLSEVNYLGQLHHPNLVKLIGYCQEGEHRLLVYEYMPRGSLESHLFGTWPQPLPWGVRVKVAIGAARGLAFLHESEQPVIYRDFKASNILLDMDFNAKLSDFGLARAGPTGDQTHVSTRVMGTQGYAAPEYIQTGRLTTKCDVFSFGVVLLELLSGRRAIDGTKVGIERNLLAWARLYISSTRRLFRIVDPRLHGRFSQKGAYMMALLAMQCVGEASQRPSMSEVVVILERLSVPTDKYK
ncbi:hypothetical protein CRG98_016415 [Punica granatum]|uniref:non-specific serine/threonine protein kinase n=1 Tax=Punica granatum TaxID=22663 RepID=A0A2I0K507_PUNGR|nr:hypothetical protein CRG98_016415 [Punica granatum]